MWDVTFQEVDMLNSNLILTGLRKSAKNWYFCEFKISMCERKKIYFKLIVNVVVRSVFSQHIRNIHFARSNLIFLEIFEDTFDQSFLYQNSLSFHSGQKTTYKYYFLLTFPADCHINYLQVRAIV